MCNVNIPNCPGRFHASVRDEVPKQKYTRLFSWTSIRSRSEVSTQMTFTAPYQITVEQVYKQEKVFWYNLQQKKKFMTNKEPSWTKKGLNEYFHPWKYLSIHLVIWRKILTLTKSNSSFNKLTLYVGQNFCRSSAKISSFFSITDIAKTESIYMSRKSLLISSGFLDGQ